MAAEDKLQERYYELLRLQRRVNQSLDTQIEESRQGLDDANQSLQREVDKLVRLDADPEIFKAIARAAWEAPDSQGFAKLAREIEAKIRLNKLTVQYGEPAAFRNIIKETGQKLDDREKDLTRLEGSIERLEKRLKPIQDFNRKNSVEISMMTRDDIANSSWWENLESNAFTRAKKVVKGYNAKYQSNVYDDIDSLGKKRKEAEGLQAEISLLEDKKFQQLAAYKEVRDVQQVLSASGAKQGGKVDLEGFQAELCKRLANDSFITCFAQQTPSGIAGPVILAALTAQVRQKIQDGLTGYKEQVHETTELLEGPIGTIARAVKTDSAIDGIERDIKSQAVLAGYFCECAAAAGKSLSQFRPDHTEGPVSLNRDMQMHMTINGKVDAAYIHEVCGMDRVLARYFNVGSNGQAAPDFKTVLSDPQAIDRMDRHYAKFLREMAADEDVNAAGFAAGQFDVISFEQFLGRYFPAGTTHQEVAEALKGEAREVEQVEQERTKMGISPEGPRLPEFGAG